MATAPPARPPGRFLRYEFHSAAQLRRHCRLVDGRVLLFFPDAHPALGPRSRVLLEICFALSGQQISLPGMVYGRELHGDAGTWLELRALSVVAGLQPALAGPRRAQRRLAIDQLAWVTHGDGPVLACPVLDLSLGGARLWGVAGPSPVAGKEIRVRPQQGPTLLGRIAWAHGREVGVQFAAESRPAAAKLFGRVESLWAAARFARHDPACACAAGGELRGPASPSPSWQGGLR